MRLPLMAVVGGLIAGCASSPPMHYYTLSEAPASSTLSLPDNTTPIRLDRVTIPTELDRSQIVRRLDSTRLQIVENDRWAAPLDETIRRVLSDDLAARLPPGAIANVNEPSIGEKRQLLAVDISEFYGDPTCAVTLRAAWTLKQTETRSAHGTEEVRGSADGACTSSASVPGAMSQALGLLSDRIAAGLAHSGGPPTPGH